MLRRGHLFLIVLMTVGFSAGNVMAGPPQLDCSVRSAGVLKYDNTNFLAYCVVPATPSSPRRFYAYFSPELGSLSGYGFDTSYYRVSQGMKTFIGGAAARPTFDKRLRRSYVQIPDSTLTSVDPALLEWLRDPSNSPTVLNRVNVRDADGCLAYTVDYAALSDFIPPSVGLCANLAP